MLYRFISLMISTGNFLILHLNNLFFQINLEKIEAEFT